MHSSIFREYDIRGKVPQELNPDQVYDLTLAIAYYLLREKSSLQTIVVGKDGRTSSPQIKEQVCKALIDSGLNVIDIGVCPSPVLYFAVKKLCADGGLMITASHNPKEYNGIKIVLGDNAIWGKKIKDIQELYTQGKRFTPGYTGKIMTANCIDAYIEYMLGEFPELVGSSMSVVFDCGNGAAGAVIPQLVQAFSWSNSILLYEDVDGTYPNHEADPTILENMQDVKETLAKSGADIGIGFDGDGDRMAAITKDGFLVPGDQLLAVFAQDMVQDNPGMAVVFDCKSSQGLIDVLTAWQAKPYMSACGHALIKEAMHQHKALLGGELSCHFVFADRYFGFDDGIYAALRLLSLLHKTKKSLSQLLTIFPKKISSPEFRIPCSDDKKQQAITAVYTYFARDNDSQLTTIDGVRVTKPFGWGIIRASNTQPVLSLRFESDTQKGLDTIKQSFIDALSGYLSDDVLALLEDGA